jgi:hypothetical protein
MGGSKSAKALTAVDLPVPLSPKTNTPPTLGSMATTWMARVISSCPTMAAKGKLNAIQIPQI